MKAFANGDRHEGEYCLDLRQGCGTYHWANGDCYEGDWEVRGRWLVRPAVGGGGGGGSATAAAAVSLRCFVAVTVVCFRLLFSTVFHSRWNPLFFFLCACRGF